VLRIISCNIKMKWNRTKAFINKIRGKKTPTGLRVNAKGETVFGMGNPRRLVHMETM